MEYTFLMFHTNFKKFIKIILLSKYLNHIIKKTLKTMKENLNFINNLIKYQKYFLEKLL